jgi:isonocardicin synthase
MADQKAPVLTEAIQSYDGIFKGMYDSNLRQQFLRVRELLSQGKLNEGKTLLDEALAEAECHPSDKSTLDLVNSELERYIKYHITNTSDIVSELNWGKLKTRKLERLVEKHWDLPQSIFFLTFNIGPTKYRLTGRKLLSDLWIQNKIPEIHCSFITAGMILGVFSDLRISEASVNVFHHPLTNGEKLRIMKEITDQRIDNVELIYPFSLLRESSRKELCSPTDGWVVDDAFDVMLGCGEEKIRAYTIKFLKTLNSKNLVLFDPACSTGVFLSTLKNAFPDSFTIGQDLSKQMVGFSKTRVDEVHWGNAMKPKISPGSADVVFVRFLNSEVVTSAEAEQLLTALLPTVKTGNYMVIFGHTPVLLSSAHLSMIDNFIVKQCIGTADDKSGIFQYYVLQRVL